MKTKIIINPIGGLANRMRAIASGISLAHKLKSEYSIIWAKNWELKAEFNDIFRSNPMVDGKIFYPSELSYALLYSVPRKKNVFFSEVTLKRFGCVLLDCQAKMQKIIQLENGYDVLANLVESTLKKNQNVYIQSGVEFYNYSGTLYRELFKPNDMVLQRVKSVEKQLGENRIGLHIRRTDNIESIKQSPDNLFCNKIEEVMTADSSVKFYLATDDEQTKVRFKTKYPGIVLTNMTPAVRDSKEGIIDAVVEMTILSRTRQIFGSFYSSYSEAAAILGNIPLEQLRQTK